MEVCCQYQSRFKMFKFPKTLDSLDLPDNFLKIYLKMFILKSEVFPYFLDLFKTFLCCISLATVKY